MAAFFTNVLLTLTSTPPASYSAPPLYAESEANTSLVAEKLPAEKTAPPPPPGAESESNAQRRAVTAAPGATTRAPPLPEPADALYNPRPVSVTAPEPVATRMICDALPPSKAQDGGEATTAHDTERLCGSDTRSGDASAMGALPAWHSTTATTEVGAAAGVKLPAKILCRAAGVAGSGGKTVPSIEYSNWPGRQREEYGGGDGGDGGGGRGGRGEGGGGGGGEGGGDGGGAGGGGAGISVYTCGR